RPNAVARGLASKKTTTVGAIMPDISSSFFSELARGIEDIASMYNYNIILSSSDQNKEKEVQLINTMLEKQVDGVVYVGCEITEEQIKQSTSKKIHIVLAAIQDEQHELNSLNNDYAQAAYEVTKNLIERSKELHVLITGNKHIQSNGLKYEGYERALKEANIPLDESYIFSNETTYNGGMEAVTEMLEQGKRTDSIF